MSNTPLVFLDVDGVLNDHKPHPNGYCAMVPDCVAWLSYVLLCVPDARIVLSSAWRYIVLSGDMSLKGFEYLLLIHGAPYETVHDRIVGYIPSDEQTCQDLGILDVEPLLGSQGRQGILDPDWLRENGCDLRAVQIEWYAQDRPFVVLDDLPLGVANLVQTDPEKGLTRRDALRAVSLLEWNLKR